ncbi:MAG: ABC transporter permease [Dysgonomonas sp.]
MAKFFDIDNWQEIWAVISRNKLRSILTGFGVFWGIFMLIFLMGIGNGFEGGILKNFNGISSNASFFWTERTSEAYKGYRKGRSWTMNTRDIALIREKAQSVEHISPMLFGQSSDKNVVRGHKSGSYGITGIYPAHFSILKQNVLKGRLFNTLDIQEKRKVCIIGREVYETLFGHGEDPIGQYIRANGIYFQVIGVISPKSENINIGGNPLSTVFIPFSTMQQTLQRGDDIYFMACTAKAGYPSSMVEEEVKTILRTAHSISPTDQKAIGGFNTEQIFMIFQYLFVGVSVLIWFVGMGTLASGIIGISNIMLVTVRERTREIGIRRALGAKPITIVAQILSESFVLTAVSGFWGLFVAIIVLGIFDNMMIKGVIEIKTMIPPFVPFKMAIVAFVVLLISGIIAGLIPAMRALRVKAIDAIREE